MPAKHLKNSMLCIAAFFFTLIVVEISLRLYDYDSLRDLRQGVLTQMKKNLAE